MAKLSQLTDRAAVLRAVSEMQQVGRESFLSQYGFDRSRGYFLRVDGELYDSKPIVAAAYGIQHPSEGPLAASEFSGGADNAVRALERLGFEVVNAAQLYPPELGDEYPDRTAIYEKYGGVKVQGIMRFPGDTVINVFSDADGPYTDDPPTLTEPFGYRGEGLVGPQKLTSGNARLEEARTQRQAVRFWHRPRGEQFTFVSWVAVLGRRWVLDEDSSGTKRTELEWQLQAIPGPDSASWPSLVIDTIADADMTVELQPAGAETAPSLTYDQLVARVEQRGQHRRTTGVVRTDYARSEAARRAVLIRCGGRCENPDCTGMPDDHTRAGHPILDVDHIKDLALGGDDHPRNMIAVCPNCHAMKTRGSRAAHWRRRFKTIAESAHANPPLLT